MKNTFKEDYPKIHLITLAVGMLFLLAICGYYGQAILVKSYPKPAYVPSAVTASQEQTTEPEPTAAPITPVKEKAIKYPSIAVIGDSISRGFNACDQVADCIQASWAGGSKPEVKSLLSRLTEKNKRAATFTDVSVSGAMIADRAAAVQSAVNSKASVIYVLIGSNDVCTPTPESMTTVTDWKKNMTKIVSSISKGSPNSHIVVMSIPNIYNLWNVGRKIPSAVKVWEQFRICQSMLASPNDSSQIAKDRRLLVLKRLQAFNAASGKICNATPKCSTDRGTVYRSSFSAKDLSSIDYFHPSIIGQKRIASVAWNVFPK